MQRESVDKRRASVRVNLVRRTRTATRRRSNTRGEAPLAVMTESELTSSTMKRCADSEDPDESSSGLESLRESERIIAFTDAVVAVAITLLILPLMEFATGMLC